MHRCGTLHALAQPSQSPSRLSSITSQAIRIALSASKMGASRKRNDSVTKRLPCPAPVAFGRDSNTRRVAGRHPDTGRLSGDIRTHHALSGDFWTLKRLRTSESCPRTLAMSENRPRIPRRRTPPELPAASGRRPANAAQLPQRYRYSGERHDERVERRTPAARARACFHVPNNFLTPEYPLRRYAIVTQILPFTYEEGRYATHPNPA